MSDDRRRTARECFQRLGVALGETKHVELEEGLVAHDVLLFEIGEKEVAP